VHFRCQAGSRTSKSVNRANSNVRRHIPPQQLKWRAPSGESWAAIWETLSQECARNFGVLATRRASASWLLFSDVVITAQSTPRRGPQTGLRQDADQPCERVHMRGLHVGKFRGLVDSGRVQVLLNRLTGLRNEMAGRPHRSTMHGWTEFFGLPFRSGASSAAF